MALVPLSASPMPLSAQEKRMLSSALLAKLSGGNAVNWAKKTKLFQSVGFLSANDPYSGTGCA